jgi:DNA polymerase III delta subunit
VVTYAGKPRKTTVDKLKGAKSIPVGIMERDLPFWVKERAARKGVELTADAIEFLIGTVGAEAGLLSSEIEKFATYGSGRLSRDDISAMVTGGGDHSPFDLVDALRAGNAEQAFRIYAVLSETQEPYALLGVLNWHYGKIRMDPGKRAQIFGLLNNADLMVKSTGGAYPLEHLLAKLLRT